MSMQATGIKIIDDLPTRPYIIAGVWLWSTAPNETTSEEHYHAFACTIPKTPGDLTREYSYDPGSYWYCDSPIVAIYEKVPDVKRLTKCACYNFLNVTKCRNYEHCGRTRDERCSTVPTQQPELNSVICMTGIYKDPDKWKQGLKEFAERREKLELKVEIIEADGFKDRERRDMDYARIRENHTGVADKLAEQRGWEWPPK